MPARPGNLPLVDPMRPGVRRERYGQSRSVPGLLAVDAYFDLLHAAGATPGDAANQEGPSAEHGAIERPGEGRFDQHFPHGAVFTRAGEN